MTCSSECTQFDLAMELLIENGFDGIAETVGLLMNTAMKLERSRHLNAGLYERKADRIGYANGYKGKTMRTRFGEVDLAIPQTRGTEFYPQSLERGLRSERALKRQVISTFFDLFIHINWNFHNTLQTLVDQPLPKLRHPCDRIIVSISIYQYVGIQ
jgi:hypothetical protein